jgi:hypothetical protein
MVGKFDVRAYMTGHVNILQNIPEVFSPFDMANDLVGIMRHQIKQEGLFPRYQPVAQVNDTFITHHALQYTFSRH